MKKIHKEKGFTLIELLVVIAIIAILSTVVMAGLNSARLKGRDAKRLSDAKSVQASLELFFDTCSGYPLHAGLTLSAGANITTFLGLASGCPAGVTLQNYLANMNPNPRPTDASTADYTYCSALPTAAMGTCSVTEPTGYQFKFGLEGAAGSLPLGVHYATPSGIR